jgi:uncharacterized protein (DUF1330 family)
MALEGEAKPPLSVVIVEFPSRAHAQAFHNDPDYAPLKRLRQANIAMEVFVVEPVCGRAGVAAVHRCRVLRWDTLQP